MGKYEKLLLKILEGKSDANISFNELCQLLEKLGFEKRIRGSHHIFRKAGITEKPNLQKDRNKAKDYQIPLIRTILLKYKLEIKD